jgi:hypothetical protein
MLNGAFGAGGPDLYPEALSSEIDAVNERVYDRMISADSFETMVSRCLSHSTGTVTRPE